MKNRFPLGLNYHGPTYPHNDAIRESRRELCRFAVSVAIGGMVIICGLIWFTFLFL